MKATDSRRVLAPGLSYDDVARALADWDGGSTDHLPGLGGEPISARWTLGSDEVRYSANPVIGLRVLEGSGVEQLGVPPMSAAEALRLTRSTVEAEAMLGATALGLLGEPGALPRLADLSADATADVALRGAADLAIRRLGLDAVRAGAQRLADRRAGHPDRDPVFGLLGPAGIRRQVLRRFLADPPAERRRRLEVVGAALADDDWEVRWSAVIGAHDLGLAETVLAVRRCSVGDGPDRDQREVLEVLRDVVGHRLARRSSMRPGAPRVAAILDGDDTDPDPPFLLVTSLRRALPDEPDASGPAGYLRVPTVPHWLGNADTAIRRTTPTASYLIAATPLPEVPMEDVQERLAELTADAGRACRLPTADELEMATRGPDGRRFPWGNAREPGWRYALSPWGLSEPLLTPEWVRDGKRNRALPPARQDCGGLSVDVRRAALRPVITG